MSYTEVIPDTIEPAASKNGLMYNTCTLAKRIWKKGNPTQTKKAYKTEKL